MTAHASLTREFSAIEPLQRPYLLTYEMEDDAGISELVGAGLRFSDWLRRIDLERAKEFVKLWDAFLKEQI